MAIAFIPNPDKLPQVNHINEVKSDNYFENLEWVNESQNRTHGTCIERQRSNMINGRLSCRVLQIDQNNNVVKEWESMSEAGRKGFNQGLISLCCKGKQKTHKGFKWVKLKKH